MKVSLIGDKYCQEKEILDMILSNQQYELVYLNLHALSFNDYYDLENYCNDVDIIFTLFNGNDKNNYLINKYGAKVKPLEFLE